MNIEEQRNVLMGLGVSPDDMYVYTNGRRPSLIVRRPGMEVLESVLNVRYRIISVTESAYGRGSNVTVVVEGKGDTDDMLLVAMGSANPDTTSSGYVSDIAFKRARHKVILKFVDLYKHGVMSEEESEEFRVTPKKETTQVYVEAIDLLPKKR